MKPRHIQRLAAQLGAASLALALTVGCGHSCVTRGVDMYAQGNYVGAAEYFEHTQGRLEQAESPERARYGLYRGATLLSLGDYNAADHWILGATGETIANAGPDIKVTPEMLRRALRVRASMSPAVRGSGEQVAQRDAL